MDSEIEKAFDDLTQDQCELTGLLIDVLCRMLFILKSLGPVIMKPRRCIYLLLVFCVTRADVNGQDSLTVIDVNPPPEQLVESASLAIPEGVLAAVSFRTANTNAWAESSQGIKLNFGGRVFTLSQNLTGTNVTNSIVAASIPLTSMGVVVGPVNISLFCSNAPARLQVYTQTKTDESTVVGQIFGDDTVQVELAQGELLQLAGFWPFATAADVTLPSGAMFVSARRIADYQITNSNGTVTTYTNVYASNLYSGGFALLAWGSGAENSSSTVNGYSFNSSVIFGGIGRTGISPAELVAGPATVTIKLDHNNTNGLAMYGYRKLPATYALDGLDQETANPPTNTNSGTAITLQLQRSTNLSDWETTDNYYINETSDKAFYRLKPVAQ
jgi:hypothetical protein